MKEYQLNKFKGPQGIWLSRGLFADIHSISDVEPMYWLQTKVDPKSKLLVLREEFLKLGDITGIELANKFLGGYEHFRYLLDIKWFKEIFDLWKEELALIKQAKALQKIEEIADSESAQAFQASKYLAGKEYEATPAKQRGRPSKEEVSGALKNEVRKLSEAEEDYKRMTGLTLINGGKQ